MSWSRNVYSTMVQSVGYDDETKELTVTWNKSGKVSVYENVPEELAVQLSLAPSVGRMINDEIKPYYQHRYQ